MGNKQYPSKLAAWKNVISEPKKLALTKTMREPTHMMTKIDVMMVFVSPSVLIDRVVQRRRHRSKGPHKSPMLGISYSFSAPCGHFTEAKEA